MDVGEVCSILYLQRKLQEGFVYFFPTHTHTTALTFLKIFLSFILSFCSFPFHSRGLVLFELFLDIIPDATGWCGNL